MDVLRVFLEQQPLFALFPVVGLGYALGTGEAVAAVRSHHATWRKVQRRRRR